MIKIAITGNIAAGKSVVEKILKDLHYPVIDTDKIVHNLFVESDDLNSELRAAFGDFDICTNHLIDRKKLAKIVFSDKKLLSNKAIALAFVISKVQCVFFLFF